MAKGGKPKASLGKGLTTLLSDLSVQDAGSTPPLDQLVPIEMIRANPLQPRREFNKNEQDELTESVKTIGIIQPLILRRDPDNQNAYMIVAGERRWRAAQRANLHEVPAVIRELSDNECLEVGLIENIQRSDLNPIEEASAFLQLVEKFGHTQERISDLIGKSRSFIANRMRLLHLPDDVQDHVRAGRLSAGHGIALAAGEDPSNLAQKTVDLHLSVKQAEELVKREKEKDNQSSTHTRPRKDANTRVLESALSAALKTKVKINLSGKKGAGSVVLGFADLDQLQNICDLLRRNSLDKAE